MNEYRGCKRFDRRRTLKTASRAWFRLVKQNQKNNWHSQFAWKAAGPRRASAFRQKACC